jgi:hypothetical protein
MRSRVKSLLVVGAVSALSVVAWAGQTQKPASTARAAWEYRVFTEYSELPAENLGALGAQGWELVAVENSGGDAGNTRTFRRYYYFKRAK